MDDAWLRGRISVVSESVVANRRRPIVEMIRRERRRTTEEIRFEAKEGIGRAEAAAQVQEKAA